MEKKKKIFVWDLSLLDFNHHKSQAGDNYFLSNANDQSSTKMKIMKKKHKKLFHTCRYMKNVPEVEAGHFFSSKSILVVSVVSMFPRKLMMPIDNALQTR